MTEPLTDYDKLSSEFNDHLMHLSKRVIDGSDDAVSMRIRIAILGKACVMHGCSLLGNMINLGADKSISMAQKVLKEFQSITVDNKQEIADAIIKRREAAIKEPEQS